MNIGDKVLVPFEVDTIYENRKGKTYSMKFDCGEGIILNFPITTEEEIRKLGLEITR